MLPSPRPAPRSIVRTRVFALSILLCTFALAGCAGSGSGSTTTATNPPVAAPAVATTRLSALPTATLGEGLPLGLVANVQQASGSLEPTGTVSFTEDNAVLGGATLDGSGRAIVTVTSLTSGTHLLTASYSGDGTYGQSASAQLTVTVAVAAGTATYTNPLRLSVSGGATAVSCADPATIKVQTGGTNTWYIYCTSDALYAGDPATHYINIFESKDLVSWTYDGDAFSGLPRWAPNGQLWAPAIRYMNGQYMLYYTSPSSNIAPSNGAAIGVGVSSSPKGPFVDYGAPVVEPEPTVGDCCGGRARSTIDPDVEQYNGQNYVSFGSFDGGILVRRLSADGFTSDPSSETQIGASNRYEGGAMWQHGGYFYLFASSANCCNGPLTGYSVFVGRAASPMGPFVDQQGVSMAAVNAGGNEVLAQNGNRWIGPGGNVLFTDESGRDYMLYHAVPSNAPVYAGTENYTARPALIDPVEWGSDGWPTVRGGFGPSATPQPAPAAQPGGTNAYVPVFQTNDAPEAAVASLSDEFDTATLSPQWTTLHNAPKFSFGNGAINLPTVDLDSCCQMKAFPMLVENAPATDYIVETKLTVNLPVSGSGASFAQGDLFIYGNDQNFVRLDLYGNAGTRQVEFIKQRTKDPAYSATSGASNLTEPTLNGGVVTAYLRIAKRTIDRQATYTAYSSQDGKSWTRGATWAHTLTDEKIGIAGGNRSGFIASFDYVHVSTLQ